MITVDIVRNIEKQKIEEEAKSKIDTVDWHADRHNEIMVKVTEARDKANEEFPTVLAMIENRIRRAIDGGITSSIAYTFDETFRDTFIVSLLIPVITLSGFSCKLRENKLDISW